MRTQQQLKAVILAGPLWARFQSTKQGQGATQAPPQNAGFKGKLNILGGEANAAEARREAKARKKKEQLMSERREKLVFRDVAEGLDRVDFRKDTFLWYRYLKYGPDFAVDAELERLLRYYNEHAAMEIKGADNGKLMRGPNHLIQLPTDTSAATTDTTSIVGASLAFPRVVVSQVAQFLPRSVVADQIPHIRALPNGASSATNVVSTGQQKRADSYIGKMRGAVATAPDGEYLSGSSPPGFDAPDDRKLVFLGGGFKRPAIVILSQLGQKQGAEATEEWIAEALKYVDPVDGNAQPKTAANPLQGSAIRRPIDIYSFRSLDVYDYPVAHRLYVRRYAQSIAALIKGHTPNPAVSPLTSPLSKAVHTFVGTGLYKAFMGPPFHLRNFLSPTVLLVDHNGNIRWMSSGTPDEVEKAYFPKLLTEIELAYYKSSRK